MEQSQKIRNLRKACIASIVLAASLGLTSYTFDKFASEKINFPETLDKEAYFRFSHSLELSLTHEGSYPTIDEVVFDENTKGEQSLELDTQKQVIKWLTQDKKLLMEQIAEITVYDDIITKSARKYTFPKSRLYSLIRNESKGDRTVPSYAGAASLTQLMPSVAKEFKIPMNKYVDYRYFPKINIESGFSHLFYLSERFNHNWVLAFIGYNAGASVAEKYRGKSWKYIKNDLIKAKNNQTIDFVINNLALNTILLNPALYDFEISKKPLLSDITFEYTIKPKDTIASIMKRFCVSYHDLKYYNEKTHKAFDKKPKVGLKEGYILLIPQAL
jgi:hypothetical protein